MLHKANYSFRTIQGPAQGQYKEKGSRFLAFAYPVSSEAEIMDHLGSLEKEYHDARHHCYAWTLGPEKKLFRAHDAGEPNHSAGAPILGQIRSRDLTDVLVVVVRYFGGTKLGVGGLISAYKTAAAGVLESASVIVKDVLREFEIRYDYASTPEVMRLIKDFELSIKDHTFQEHCVLTASCKAARAPEVLQKLELLKTLGHVSAYKCL